MLERKNRFEKRLEQYSVMLNSAYRTGRGDPETLIELIRAAMGNRSQRKFAGEIGVNVSSISRILSGKVSEISDTLLAKIAANAAPDSGVTIEKLMAAQGVVEAENRRELGRKFEENCRRIFADELLRKGYSVSYPTELSCKSRYLYDFGIQTDALPKGNGLWLVNVRMMSGRVLLPTGMGSTQIWIDSAMAAYYRGESIGRISMVVELRSMFEQIKTRLEEVPVRDEISVLLISEGAGKIVDEYIAPLIDKSMPRFTFAKMMEEDGE